MSLQRHRDTAGKLREQDHRMLIGGQWCNALSEQTMTIVDPATNEEIGQVPLAGDDDVEAAVRAAEQAFAEWKTVSGLERGRLLRKLAAKIAEHSDEAAEIDAIDSGNPISFTRIDVQNAIDHLEYYSGLGLELKGETVPAPGGNLHLTRLSPFGVVARIIPFNHPFFFAARMVAAPLMAGNAVILKAPDQAPLAPLFFAKLANEVLPPGLVNVLTGDGPGTGAALVKHPRIRRLSLTGSRETGLIAMRDAASVAVKRVTLELGGKNPMIVCSDIDVDQVARSIVQGMNFTSVQGQSCGSTSRIFIHREVCEPVLDRILELVAGIRVGFPLDPDTDMGAIISGRQLNRVKDYVRWGQEQGARLVFGGTAPAEPELAAGNFLLPTVFDRVTIDMRIAREEIFGPVVSILTWDDENEVVDAANSLPLGLTASIWTSDIARALRLADAVESGYIWINGSSRHHIGTDFGGWRDSGIGREEGLEELLSYTEAKTIHMYYR